MSKHVKKPKLNRSSADRKKLLRNLLTSLVTHGKIVTTRAKAKALRSFAERTINRAKRGDVSSVRYVIKRVYTKDAVRKLTTEIAERFKDRDSGFLRIINLGPRQSDSSLMAEVSFIDYDKYEGKAKDRSSKWSRGSKVESVRKSLGKIKAKKVASSKIKERLVGKAQTKKDGSKDKGSDKQFEDQRSKPNFADKLRNFILGKKKDEAK